MAEVSSNDEELVSAFEDAVEKIESLAMEQPEQKAQSEDRAFEKMDRHTDQIEDSVPDEAQGLEIGANNDSFTSGEADEIKGIFENYIESQYEYAGTEVVAESESSGLDDTLTIAHADEGIDDDLLQTDLTSEAPVSNFDSPLSSVDTEDTYDLSNEELVNESENYHFSDKQTDAILSSDQTDSFFDEDVLAIDANKLDALDHEDEESTPNVSESHEEDDDIELIDASETYLNESVTDTTDNEYRELEKVHSSDDEKSTVSDSSVSDYTETPIESAKLSINEEPDDAIVDDSSLSVVTEMNSSSRSHGNLTKRRKTKSASRAPIIVGVVICVLSLSGLGFLNYRLQLQVDKLNNMVVLMEGQIKGFKESKRTGAASVNLSTQANKRIDELVAQVNKLNGALVHLNGREDGALRNQNKSSAVELSALYGMISSLEQQFQEFKVKPGGLVATKNKASVRPKEQVPNTNRKQTWSVQLMSVRRKGHADRLLAEFQSKGIPVEQQVVTVKGRLMYRLGVSGLVSRKKATEYGEEAIKQLGLDSFWVSR